MRICKQDKVNISYSTLSAVQQKPVLAVSRLQKQDNFLKLEHRKHRWHFFPDIIFEIEPCFIPFRIFWV